MRSLCGPTCREQPGTGENSRREASAFTRVFPRVPGCARSTNVSGSEIGLAFLCDFLGLCGLFAVPKPKARLGRKHEHRASPE